MKILIIEDDHNLSNVIKRCIEDDYQTEQAFDGEEGLYYAEQNIYDLILLDIMLPELNGYQILERLRRQGIHTPVLLLTARGTLDDKTRGFRAGADDYLVKPFDPDELLLRINAIIRRSMGIYQQNKLSFKEMLVDMDSRKIRISGQQLKLKGKQYDILEFLVSHQGKLVSKDQIFDKIWGFTTDTTSNVVEVYASGIRKILKAYNYDTYFKTVRGVGYILTDES